MATENWPASLPQIPIEDGHRESPPNLVLRTKMDAGPDKVRRQFTAGPRTIKVNLFVTSAQLDTFDAFYLSTISGGAEPFNWKNPRDQATTVDCMILPVPTYTPAGGDFSKIEFDMEILP